MLTDNGNMVMKEANIRRSRVNCIWELYYFFKFSVNIKLLQTKVLKNSEAQRG